MLEISKNIWTQTFPTQNDGDITLLGIKEPLIVLFFYPKDNTPGCSIEVQDFRDALKDFQRKDAKIIGVSRDDVASHNRFVEKFSLSFPLIADVDEELCNEFEVIKQKNMFGKQVRGIERSTFILNNDGVILKEWRKVKVDGHVDEVLTALSSL